MHESGDYAHPDARLLVLARAPVAGHAKTRLIPALGAAGAARLQARLVWDTLARATRTALCPVTLWCDPSVDEPFFARCREAFGTSLEAQPAGDIGERMSVALESALAGADRAVLIGTDCPGLSPAALAGALEALGSGADAVLGPAADGGYVLIGLRRADRALFEGMPWGGPRVLEETRRRLRALGWTWRELEPLRDIDRPRDLAGLDLDALAVPPAPFA